MIYDLLDAYDPLLDTRVAPAHSSANAASKTIHHGISSCSTWTSGLVRHEALVEAVRDERPAAGHRSGRLKLEAG
jgi:hypothetical protein